MEPQLSNTKRPYARPVFREMSAKEVARKITEHAYRTEGRPVPFSAATAGIVVDEYAQLAISEWESAGHEVRVCSREGRVFYEIDRAMLQTPESVSALGAEMFRVMEMHAIHRKVKHL